MTFHEIRKGTARDREPDCGGFQVTTTETPRVWVGCLACYNAGTLRGEWVDATEAADFVPCEGRGHEEWWVFDHEGFGGLLAGECSPVEAQELAEQIDAVDDWQRDASVALNSWADEYDFPECEIPIIDTFRGEPRYTCAACGLPVYVSRMAGTHYHAQADYDERED